MARATNLTADATKAGNGLGSVPDHICVDLFGGLQVRAGGITLGPRQLGGTKPRHVLIALLLSRGAPVPKDTLISLLWGDTPPAGATATLETYVCVLRKKLQPGQSARSSLIRTVAGCYAIDMSQVDLDLARYESLIAKAMNPDVSPTAALSGLREALALAEASLLPEETDTDWLDEPRRLHAQRAQENLVAGAAKVAHVAPADSARWSRMALDIDPLDEAAWYTYLLSKLSSGQHADGLRAYDRCRRLLASELGCAPGPGLQELYERLLLDANDEDDELRCLFDAVLRLHNARSAAAVPDPRDHSADFNFANPQNCSVEQACQTLDGLLRSVKVPQFLNAVVA
jgi:SARP family transcriptional regulator, regulator of embCAB operon